MKNKLELLVTGMSCQHCVATVTSAIKSVDSSAKVDIDLKTGKVKIESDNAIDRDKISSAISQKGYTVK